MGARTKDNLTKPKVPMHDKGNDDGVPDPKVGMEFESEGDVYDFYNKHARKVGFSIRKNWRTTDRQTGLVKTRRYVCSKEGHRVADKRDKNVKHHRDETRTGCEAYMTVRIQLNGKYRVTETNLLHNHPLATPQQVHLLRSQRKFSVANAAVANDSDSSGSTPKNVEFMSREGEGQENVGCIHVDSKNYLRSKRMKAMQKFDAGGLLECFKNKQLEDPSFFYSIQLDADDHIANVFWSDGRMLIDYERFDMNSILQDGSLKEELKRYLHPTQNILQFFEDFQRMVDEKHYAELKANFKMTQSSPKVIVPVDILTHASSVYTPKMFEMFQTEYVNGLNCIVKGCTEVRAVKKYEVFDGKGRCHVVTLDSMDEAIATCSCKKYEFLGILCGHVLRVIGNTIRFVPTKYILKRWTQEASTLSLKTPSSGFKSGDDHKKAFSRRYNHLVFNFVKVATRASESEEAYRCATDLLDKMWQDIERIWRNLAHEEPSINVDMERIWRNSAREEPSIDVESFSDEGGARDDSLKLTVDDLQFKEANEFRRKMGSGSGGHSMKAFFEKPPASSTVHSNTCPAPIYYPVPSTPPTLFLQGNSPHDFYRESVYSMSNLSRESSLFGTSQQFVIGSSSRESSKE
ncbi:hypothetical protein MRB53_007790 [Persea americana]|uniref:Uncharacterized protein n=1 Tax=Persea americana TaxID=3435 RepID=A0ACC2MJZ6_PERAE|nr:hypothetical protein MRB53_007790 [Persea americana]